MSSDEDDGPRYNFRQFLRDMFQSPQGLLSFLRAYNVKLPKESAVAKWFYRDTVPAKWFATLLSYLQIERGEPVSVADYLTGAQNVSEE